MLRPAGAQCGRDPGTDPRHRAAPPPKGCCCALQRRERGCGPTWTLSLSRSLTRGALLHPSARSDALGAIELVDEYAMARRRLRTIEGTTELAGQWPRGDAANHWARRAANNVNNGAATKLG